MNKAEWRRQAGKWGAGLLAAGLLLGGGVLPAGEAQAAAAKTKVQSGASAKAVSSKVVLKVNGAVSAHTGLYREGRVWVPVAFIRDSLKKPVSYDKKEEAYLIGSGSSKVKVTDMSYGIAVSVNNVYLPGYNGKMVDNRLYLPLEVLTDYLGYKGDWSASTGRLNVVVKPQNKLTVTTVSYNDESAAASIKLDYPQISGLSNAAVQNKINAVLKDTMASSLKGIREDLSKRSDEERQYLYENGYLVTYNQDGVLSLIVNRYIDMGGAHGMTFREAYNFSLKDGKQLLLGDLFGANKNYKKQLNAAIAKELKTGDWGYLGGFNGLTTEKSYYLKDGKAVVFFQLYEYTPYAAGFPEFDFTFKELLPDGSSPFAKLK